MVLRITTDRCRYCGRCFEAVLYHERDSCPLRPPKVRPAWRSLAWWVRAFRGRPGAKQREENRDAR